MKGTIMIKLQSLRIPSGWEVVINKFLDVDVTQCSSEEDVWLDLTQDILHIRSTIKKNKIGIDLGWYPENDSTGAFHLIVIEDGNWEEPLQEIDSRDKDEIVNQIETFLLRY